MARNCRAGENEFKRARVLEFHAKNPDVPYSVIKTRFGISLETVKRWLSPAEKAKNPAPAHSRPLLAPADAMRVDDVDGAGVTLDNLLDDERLTVRPRSEAFHTMTSGRASTFIPGDL